MKLATFKCKKCGKRTRREAISRGRPPTICDNCRRAHERIYQRDYARRRAAEKRAST